MSPLLAYYVVALVIITSSFLLSLLLRCCCFIAIAIASMLLPKYTVATYSPSLLLSSFFLRASSSFVSPLPFPFHPFFIPRRNISIHQRTMCWNTGMLQHIMCWYTSMHRHTVCQYTDVSCLDTLVLTDTYWSGRSWKQDWYLKLRTLVESVPIF